MKFERFYEIINDNSSGKIWLKHKIKNKVLPYLFDYVDLEYVDKVNHNIVRVKVDGKLKLFDLKDGKIFDYTIKRWAGDHTDRYITMVLNGGNCSIFDCLSKKMYILPRNVSKTYVNTYCEDNYCLVQLDSGEFTFYHLRKYFTLDVRYSLDEIRKLGGKMCWKDIIKRSPQDFTHLPLELAKNKSVINQCLKIFKEILNEKKETLPKEEYLKFKKNLGEIYNKRINSLQNIKSV